MSQLHVAPEGARCGLHVERPAAHVCPRCGAFTCAECDQGGEASLCPRCRQLPGQLPFPFSRVDHDIERLGQFVYERWRQQAVLLSLGAVIFMVIGAVGGFASNIGTMIGGPLMQVDPILGGVVMVLGVLLGLVINVVAQGFVQLGMFRVCIDALTNVTVDLGAMFGQGSKLRAYLVQLGIVFAGALIGVLSIVALVGAVLFINASVHGISEPKDALNQPMILVLSGVGVLGALLAATYWLCPIIFAPLEIVHGDAGGWESLQRAMVIGDGHRLEIIGYTLLGTLVVMAGVVFGLLALCIGLLVTVPVTVSVYELLLTAKYLALRNGCDGLDPKSTTR